MRGLHRPQTGFEYAIMLGVVLLAAYATIQFTIADPMWWLCIVVGAAAIALTQLNDW